MYDVTTVGYSGNTFTVRAFLGEALDRVRYAMESDFIESVTVEKVEN